MARGIDEALDTQRISFGMGSLSRTFFVSREQLADFVGDSLCEEFTTHGKSPYTGDTFPIYRDPTPKERASLVKDTGSLMLRGLVTRDGAMYVFGSGLLHSHAKKAITEREGYITTTAVFVQLNHDRTYQTISMAERSSVSDVQNAIYKHGDATWLDASGRTISAPTPVKEVISTSEAWLDRTQSVNLDK